MTFLTKFNKRRTFNFELKNSFNKALENNPHNSVKLIDLAIKLGYSSIKSELSNINSCEEDMNDNKLSFMVLRNLAMDHLQMFDTDYKTRSKLCEILKISEKEQLVISSSSKVKKKKLISSKR